ncbi:MAG: hypothetical protein JW881_06000, partial [Spirochaetales bacterium]|nr:hypothetical protein [Spirochaetales bacterium]
MNQKSLYIMPVMACFVLLCCVLSCLPPFDDNSNARTVDELSEKEIESVINRVESDMSSISETLVSAVATEPELLSIIHEEIGREFDGDTEALFGTVLGRVLGNGQTVYEYLAGVHDLKKQGDAGEVGDGQMFGDVLVELAHLMNLQIYMPSYEEWDGIEPPLVAFVPFTYDTEDLGYITAYDQTGVEYLIDKDNYKDRPLFILGPNERLDAEGNADAFIVDPGDSEDPSGPVLDGNVNAALTRAVSPGRDGAKEILEYFEIWNDHEPFYKGKAEIRIEFKNDKLNVLCSYDDIKEHDRKFVNKEIVAWKKDTYGETINYRMYESDGCNQKGLEEILDLISKTPAPGSTAGPGSPQATPAPGQGNPGPTDSSGIDWTAILELIKKYGCDIYNLFDKDDEMGSGVINYSDPPKEYKHDGEFVIKMGYTVAETPTTPPTATTPPGVTEPPGSTSPPLTNPPEVPTDAPPEDYTLTVRLMNSSGNYESNYYGHLTSGSIVYINAPPSILISSGGVTLELVFMGWEISGNATVDEVNATSTVVRDFRGNVTVTAVYDHSYVPTIAPSEPPPTPTSAPTNPPAQTNP